MFHACVAQTHREVSPTVSPELTTSAHICITKNEKVSRTVSPELTESVGICYARPEEVSRSVSPELAESVNICNAKAEEPREHEVHLAGETAAAVPAS